MRSISTGAAWSRVLSGFGSPKRPRPGADGEWLWSGPSETQRVDLLLPPKTAFALVCPKSVPFGWWSETGSLPSDVATLCSPHLGEPRLLPNLKALAGRGPVAFVGDLDPLAIVQFVETERLAASGKIAIVHAGVNDAWLAPIERALRRDLTLERLRIALSKDEQALLKRIERALDLERLVGARCASMLRSGFKLEIEAATNPQLYGRDHGRRLVRLIRSAVRRKAS